MTLEQAIHQRWAACQPLQSLLSADRLTTGRAIAPAVPYATLRRDATRTLCRVNDGRLDEISLRIDLWHSDYGAGLAVVDQLEAALDGAALELAPGQPSIPLRRTQQSQQQHNDALWQFTITLVAHVLVTSIEPDEH